MKFDWNKKTYIMGILNVTNDSFSGDGILSRPMEQIITQATEFVENGVDIIDIGGESTRPGSKPVGLEEELERVIPVIEKIREEMDVTISIDTYKSEVAKKALTVGVDWINDVWGFQMDPKMATVAASANCPVVLMHNRSKPKELAQEKQLGGRYIGVEYEDLLADIKKELLVSVEIALQAGVHQSNIIIDPGIGFGKTVEQNLQIINQLDYFKSLGFPILLGPSRKSFIGYTLNLPPEERLEGTAAAIAIGITKGANIIRVHDVKYMARVAIMTDAIIKSE